MAITASDIVFRLTTKLGSAGDSTASTPDTSLGKYVSTSVFSGGQGSLFDDVSGAENAASTVDYRAFAVLNNHGSLTLKNAVVYVSAETAGGTNVAIATDNTAPSAKGSSVAQGTSIANEVTAPSGTSAFSTPTTAAAGLALGDLAPGQVKLVWVKRTAANTAAQSDSATFSVSGDTEA